MLSKEERLAVSQIRQQQVLGLMEELRESIWIDIMESDTSSVLLTDIATLVSGVSDPLEQSESSTFWADRHNVLMKVLAQMMYDSWSPWIDPNTIEG